MGRASGELELSFVHNADVAVETNPEIMFLFNESTKLPFTISKDSTQVAFTGASDAGFQVGTVAGTVTLSVTVDGDNAVAPVPKSINIDRLPPVITSLSVSRTGTGFNVVVVGYSTPRSLQSAKFTFTPTPGSTLSGTRQTLELTDPATSWYESDAAKQIGSKFTMTVPFTFQGDASALGSVSVTLTNKIGTSEAKSTSL